MGKRVFFFLLLCSFLLNAHPPKSLDLSYDVKKKQRLRSRSGTRSLIRRTTILRK